MKNAGHLVRRCATGLLLAAAVCSLACTGNSISKKKMASLGRQVRTHGLIIGFEGLQPFSGHRADNLTKKVAKDLDLVQVATSGNYSKSLPLVKWAHDNSQPIYILGYSLGGNEARKLAEKCRKEGIEVDILFLLDPGAMGIFTGKIPSNVRRVVFYQSGTYDSSVEDKPRRDFLEDPSATEVQFRDLSKYNHMTLPSHLVREIEAQIQAGR